MVAAVGIALQSPDVREWLEEQRQKLVEILRVMSESLDPHTRSQAEAFAYEGRLPTQQEMQGMRDATAVASGRDTDTEVTQRRLQRQSSGPSVDVAERRRLGREYLARRNQELLDLKNKRKSDTSEKSVVEGEAITSDAEEKSAVQVLENAVATGTFDELINPDGSLRLEEKGHYETLDTALSNDTAQQPVPISVAVKAFQSGSYFGNPFGDEFAMSEPLESDGLQTPKPPVPPKIALADTTLVPGSYPPDPPISELPTTTSSPILQPSGDFEYDDQLARALSLSLAESEAEARTTLRRRRTEDEDFAQAIEDSLREADVKASGSSHRGPLVDFSADTESLHTPTNPWSVRSDDEDLYTLTPMPTGSRAVRQLVSYPELPVPGRNADNASISQTRSTDSSEYGSINLSASQTLSPRFGAALSPSSATLSPNLAARDNISTGFDSESETESFASLPRSRTLSTGSMVEVEDIDIDSMSDDDDGIRTPQSWSEVGSELADSERSESEAEDMVRI